MYVVTFYSYKGGVGRTTALINVAADLARRGRKILVVDFDLEAPGLTTYDFCTASQNTPGVVDYINDYLRDGVAPSVREYIRECTLSSDGKSFKIWVMSAGLQDRHYKSRLHSINWDTLYNEQSGYLLLENLKSQWEDEVAPDYVLIDSRTGHTDVSGICTRQLPNAVVFTFKPNRQNLSGLKQIVEEVRDEEAGPRKRKIQPIFLASDVPYVDDEYQILENTLETFQAELGYLSYETVRHYDSLELLDQVIFTLKHRRTRLAKEYVALADTIIRENAADKEGALSYLQALSQDLQEHSWRDISGKLELIEAHHPSEPDVLTALGHIYEGYDQYLEATTFFEQAEASGKAPPEALRSLGLLYLRNQRMNDAISVYKQILDRPNIDNHHINGALRVLIAINEDGVPDLLKSSSVRKLPSMEKLGLIEELRNKASLLPEALSLAYEVIGDSGAESRYKDFARRQLVPLIEIGMGRYSSAMDHLGQREKVLASETIDVVFNFAMAEWASTQNQPADLFARVIELDGQADKDEPAGVNYVQCIAVARAGVGDAEGARKLLDRARVLTSGPSFRGRQFSCWRYLNVTSEQFSDDLRQISLLNSGKEIKPEFMKRNAQKQ